MNVNKHTYNIDLNVNLTEIKTITINHLNTNTECDSLLKIDQNFIFPQNEWGQESEVEAVFKMLEVCKRHT